MATVAIKHKFEFPAGLVITKMNSNEHALGIKKDSLLDWYRLTETSRHVLNAVITQCGRLQLEEMDKADPDQDKLNQLRELSRKAVGISRDSRNLKASR